MLRIAVRQIGLLAADVREHLTGGADVDRAVCPLKRRRTDRRRLRIVDAREHRGGRQTELCRDIGAQCAGARVDRKQSRQLARDRRPRELSSSRRSRARVRSRLSVSSSGKAVQMLALHVPVSLAMMKSMGSRILVRARVTSGHSA